MAKKKTLTMRQMEDIFQKFDPDMLNHLIGIARGEVEGELPPEIASLGIEELAQLDRFTDTRRMNPLAGVAYGGLLAPAWEAWKTAQMVDPASRRIGALLAKAPPELGQFSIFGAGRTSPPSLSNLTAPIKGTAMRMFGRAKRP